jgi:hypothetical protein
MRCIYTHQGLPHKDYRILGPGNFSLCEVRKGEDGEGCAEGERCAEGVGPGGADELVVYVRSGAQMKDNQRRYETRWICYGWRLNTQLKMSDENLSVWTFIDSWRIEVGIFVLLNLQWTSKTLGSFQKGSVGQEPNHCCSASILGTA